MGLKVLFNQRKMPKNYFEETYNIASEPSLAACFFMLCKKRPDEKIVYWKDQEGNFSNSLSNYEVLKFSYLISQILKSNNPKVGIISSNNPYLYPVELAVFLKKGVSISIYETDSLETVSSKLKLSQADTLVCDEKSFSKIKDMDFKSNSKIKQILLLEKCNVPEKFEDKNEIIIEEVWPSKLNINKPLEEEKIREMISTIKKDDIVKLIFTSGTTGTPKLIPLSHHNFLTTLRGWIKLMNWSKIHRLPSFLPNAHVFQSAAVYLGFLGIFQHYITSKVDLGLDLKKIKPNILIAVPLVYDTFKGKIIDKLKGLPFLKNFNFYQPPKNNKILNFLARYIFGRLIVFKLGLEKCQWFICGGAPLHNNTFDFFDNVLGVKIRQGYGMTETAAGISANGGDVKKGSAGIVLEGVQVKIGSDGLLYVKGETVSQFGYNFEEKIIKDDGYFCTGDYAELDEENFIYLKGRSGNRVKMANGKYYNIEQVSEDICSKFSEFHFVVPVIESRNKGILVVTLNDHLDKLGPNETNNILESLAEIKKLPQFEKIVVYEEFTVENNFLTPTQKIKFKEVINHYLKTNEKLTK
ncbi:MAG: hypothetical protein CME68_04150 [Halobacteriovoraceae bacterium]|nr:hypothetical protein [Halobacteriovoraceae bacterium]